MKAILLDIDGVLNTEDSVSYCGRYLGIDNTRVTVLKRIVEATGAKIVLSSTWRYNFVINAYKQEDSMAKYLSNKLRKQGLKVYDKTPNLKHSWRGREITQWLENHPSVTDYVILDDQFFDYGHYPDTLMKHLIQTTEYGLNGGLTDYFVAPAIQILNGDLIGPIYNRPLLANW